MQYIFDVVEGEYYGQILAEGREHMLQIGTWLRERAEATGLQAAIRPAYVTGFNDYHTDPDLIDQVFSEYLIAQFGEFRAYLN